MFGEDVIIGEKTVKLNKNRIIVPQFTYGEIDDEILIMYDLIKSKLVMSHIDIMIKKLEEIETAMINLTDKEGIEKQKYIRQVKRFLYGTRCFSEEKIDKQRRILLPQRAISELEFSNSVFVVGNENRLDVYASEKQYELSLKKLNNFNK